MDFDDYIEGKKEHFLKKDCWSTEDASFLLTDFDVDYLDDCNNKKNEIKDLLESSIISEKIKPDFESNHFKPATIIKWAIDKGILKEGAFADLISKAEDDVTANDVTRNEINQQRLEVMIKELETLEEAAKANDLPFDKNNLLCSRKMLLDWIKEKQHKPANLFKISQATFNTFWSRHVKEYRCCSPASVEKDFFKKIQG